jgi:hypothetical protein
VWYEEYKSGYEESMRNSIAMGSKWWLKRYD